MISLLSVIVYLNFFKAHATERFWPNELRCPWDPESAPGSRLCVIDWGWDWGGLASRGSAGGGVGAARDVPWLDGVAIGFQRAGASAPGFSAKR